MTNEILDSPDMIREFFGKGQGVTDETVDALPHRVIEARFCLRMDPWPNTFAHDGMCAPRRHTAKRGGVDARVGPK